MAASAELEVRTIRPSPSAADGLWSRLDLVPRVLYWGTHAACLAALFVGVTTGDLVLLAATFFGRMFAITAGYHRYLAHRSFRTSRAFQFVLAVLAGTAFAEAIIFAGKHRLHHRHADTDGDVHSPRQGFWFCWFGSLVDEGYRSDEVLAMARDLTRYPELVWLRRWFFVPGVVVGAATWWLGGFSMFAIGFVLSRALLLNLVSTVNFFCHLSGTRRYVTGDASTNHALVALLTFGEGWHNNHHHYMASARQGFFWWEVDVTYYLLRGLQATTLREKASRMTARYTKSPCNRM
jgi:stearoyl-CoA desaturase (delta-9 desaturase)